jgi:hypothetical protein
VSGLRAVGRGSDREDGEGAGDAGGNSVAFCDGRSNYYV